MQKNLIPIPEKPTEIFERIKKLDPKARIIPSHETLRSESFLNLVKERRLLYRKLLKKPTSLLAIVETTLSDLEVQIIAFELYPEEPLRLTPEQKVGISEDIKNSLKP